MNKINYFKNGFLEKTLLVKDFNKENNWPKISIVMPSFNHSQYIEKYFVSFKSRLPKFRIYYN